MIEVFPSKYIHVGGDEAPKTRWKACPKCQARIKAEGLSNEHELQSYFIRRIEKHLAGKGRCLIGWDEILEGGLAPGAAVMSWRGMAGGIAAAKAGHDVVMSPDQPLLFRLPLPSHRRAAAYGFDPVAGLSPEQARLRARACKPTSGRTSTASRPWWTSRSFRGCCRWPNAAGRPPPATNWDNFQPA